MTRPRRWAAAVAWWLRPGLAHDPPPAPLHLARIEHYQESAGTIDIVEAELAPACTCPAWRGDGAAWWWCPVHRGQTTDPRGIT